MALASAQEAMNQARMAAQHAKQMTIEVEKANYNKKILEIELEKLNKKN